MAALIVASLLAGTPAHAGNEIERCVGNLRDCAGRGWDIIIDKIGDGASRGTEWICRNRRDGC
jgi:hypothetical protein